MSLALSDYDLAALTLFLGGAADLFRRRRMRSSILLTPRRLEQLFLGCLPFGFPSKDMD